MKILLKKRDAIEFFGTVGNIAKVLDINSQNVSMWGDVVPQAPAWALHHVAKGHKYRRKGKLPVIIED